MKIRTHILVLVIAAVLPILGFSAITMRNSWRREEATIQEGLLEGVRAMSLALDRQLDGDIRSLQVLADSPALRSGDLRAFYNQAARILPLQRTWFNIILSNPDGGRQLINLRYPFGADLPETALDSKTLVAIARSDRPFITPLAKGKSSGLNRIGVMIPVKTPDAKSYLLVATIAESTWLRLLSSYPVPPDSTMTLVDQDGIIIARTLNNAQWVGKPPSASLLQHIRSSTEGSTLTTGLEGQQFYSAYSRSRLAGWTVAIGVPKDAVQRALWQSSALLVFGGIYVVSLASILALLFGSRIARGVSGLAEYASILEHCREQKTKPLANIAEVDYVGATFAKAVEKIQQRDAELRISEERFRSLITATTSIVWSVDSKGRCVSPQPSWKAYTGQRWEEYHDLGWTNAIHPNDRKAVRKLWLQARKTDSSYRAEGRLWHADSESYRHFESTAVPVRNSDGSIREWIGMCVDIEDRKRAEAALLESEARFRTLADSSPDPIWVTDAKGFLAFANAAYREFFGHVDNGAEVTWQDLVHPDDKQSYLNSFHAAVAEKNSFHAKARFRRPNDRWSWFDTRGLPRFAEDGSFLGHVGSSHDITDSKSLEEQLRAADRHKDQFLAMLGHELRNPLGVASSCIQLQKMKGLLAPTLQESQDIIHRQIEHMSKLVDDLLEVSRISRGRLILHKETCDLGSIIREAAEDYRAPLEAAGLELTVTLPEDPVWVSGDRTRLAQSTGNLLHNALKFTASPGTVAVELISKQFERVALLSVRDSGIGIPPEMLDRVFESFSQAEQTLDRTKGGLGIGLYLVKQVTELQGGRAWASSGGLGQGSEFFIELPLAPRPVAATQVVDNSHISTPQRILVIDDNRLSVRALQIFLEDKGHTVEIAHDGRQGLEAARRFKPKVVLCDIGLPEIDGYTVAHQMRRDSMLRAVYLIAISGYGQDDDQLRAKRAGFDDYFTKPINLAQIEQSLQIRLAAHSPSRSYSEEYSIQAP